MYICVNTVTNQTVEVVKFSSAIKFINKNINNCSVHIQKENNSKCLVYSSKLRSSGYVGKLLTHKQKRYLSKIYGISFKHDFPSFSKYQNKRKTKEFIKKFNSWNNLEKTNYIHTQANFHRRMDSAMYDVGPLSYYISDIESSLKSIGLVLY